jgi:hypothetical protein
MVFGANFALQTGQPTSFPNGQYEYLGINVPSYGLRNENRLPTYHHLDARKKIKIETGKEWVLVFIIYITGKNASINFRQNADSGNNEAVKPLSSNSSRSQLQF